MPVTVLEAHCETLGENVIDELIEGEKDATAVGVCVIEIDTELVSEGARFEGVFEMVVDWESEVECEPEGEPEGEREGVGLADVETDVNDVLDNVFRAVDDTVVEGERVTE